MAKTRKLISLLLVVMMVVSLFAGLTTTASAAGIDDYVNVDIDWDNNYDKTLTVEVYLDNSFVATKDYPGKSDLAGCIGLSIGANSPYLLERIETPGTGASLTGSSYCFGGITSSYENRTVKVYITSRSAVNPASDSYVCGDYGTFFYDKDSASGDGIYRTVEVYLNGGTSPVGTYQIHTPDNLDNIVNRSEFWFVANQANGYYNESMSPDTALTVTTGKTIKVYVTDQNAGTPSGAVDIGDIAYYTYKEPGALGGYSLAVEVYVNGMLKGGMERRNVRGSVLGSYKLTLKNGYYYDGSLVGYKFLDTKGLNTST